MIQLTWWHPRPSFWLPIGPIKVLFYFFSGKKLGGNYNWRQSCVGCEHGQLKSHEGRSRAPSRGVYVHILYLYDSILMMFPFFLILFACFLCFDSTLSVFFFPVCAQYHLSFRPVNIDPGCWRCMVLGCRYYRGANLKRDAELLGGLPNGQKDQAKLSSIWVFPEMVVPPKHPKMIILVGKPMVVGYHHFRNPPYSVFLSPSFVGGKCWDTFIWWL